jgi:hypothetical protein
VGGPAGRHRPGNKEHCHRQHRECEGNGFALAERAMDFVTGGRMAAAVTAKTHIIRPVCVALSCQATNSIRAIIPIQVSSGSHLARSGKYEHFWALPWSGNS